MTYKSTIAIRRAFAPRRRKLTDQQVQAIRVEHAAMLAAGIDCVPGKIAIKHNVSEAAISAVVHGRRKGHVL